MKKLEEMTREELREDIKRFLKKEIEENYGGELNRDSFEEESDLKNRTIAKKGWI